MTALAPPDIEAALVTLLEAPCSTRVPTPRPAAFTKVTAVGGDQINVIQFNARVFVECWGPDETAALNRARAAWAALWAAARSEITPGVFVTSVQASTPVNFPDDASGQPRYTFTAQLTTALEAI